jgi:hypothetical protein
MSSLQQNWKKGQNRFCLEVRGGRGQRGEMAQMMYAHMNKEKKKRESERDGTMQTWGQKISRAIKLKIS